MPLEHDFDTPLVCPICRAVHEASANITGTTRPVDGDVSFCIMCGGLSTYDASKREGLRHPTDEELVDFLADPDIQKMRWAYEQVRRRMGPPKGAGYDHG